MSKISMTVKQYHWELLNESTPQSIDEVIDVILKNRELKTKKESTNFFTPQDPNKLTLKELGINKFGLEKALDRLTKAISDKKDEMK